MHTSGEEGKVSLVGASLQAGFLGVFPPVVTL